MKRAFFFVLVLLCIFSFISCDEEPATQLGSICVNLQDSKSIEPGVEETTVVSYTISGIHTDGVNRFSKIFSGSTITVKDLLSGTWVVTVEGKNADGVILVSQTQDIEVEPAKTKDASFTLSKLIGKGTFVLTVKWPISNISVASVEVTISKGGEKETLICNKTDAVIVGREWVLNKSLDLYNGSYDVSYVFKDYQGNQQGPTGTNELFIYKGLISETTIKTEEEQHPLIDAPVFSPSTEAVFIDTPISLSTTVEDVIVYYTKDGSDPLNSNTRIEYIEPFTINTPTLLRAVAIKDDTINSEIVTKNYNISLKTPTFSLEPGTYDGV